MIPRRPTGIIAAGVVLLGGCALPPQQTADWPLPPSAARMTPAAAGEDGARVLTKSALRSRLRQAGIYFPIISDERYAVVAHDSLPALLDWYAAMTGVYGFSPEKLPETGFRRDRSVRLLRVAIATTLMRAPDSPAAAPAAGMIRVRLLRAWGDLEAGDTRDFLAVLTERGLFAVDPASRRIRPLERDHASWRFEDARF